MNISTDIKQNALKLYSATLDQVIMRWRMDNDFNEKFSNVKDLTAAHDIVGFSNKLMKDYFEVDDESN